MHGISIMKMYPFEVNQFLIHWIYIVPFLTIQTLSKYL